jgi:hypothetical protein
MTRVRGGLLYALPDGRIAIVDTSWWLRRPVIGTASQVEVVALGSPERLSEFLVEDWRPIRGRDPEPSLVGLSSLYHRKVGRVFP